MINALTSSISAAKLFKLSRPQTRLAHWTRDGKNGQLFVVDGSRIFNVDASVLDLLEASLPDGEARVAQTISNLGLEIGKLNLDHPIAPPPLRSLSLAIAQKCNLGCSYCYAGQGTFNSTPKNMSREVIRHAVDLLMDGAELGCRVHLSFLGGEPLMNREGLKLATSHAVNRAKERGVELGLAITTNGTLVTEQDADFFEEHGFAVTVSLDGVGEIHDRHRPFKDGHGSFAQIMTRVQPLLAKQQKMQVSVRATVSTGNLRLRESMDYFFARGFHSVGFSPLLRSMDKKGELSETDLAEMLAAMLECGQEFERRLQRGERYAFTNMVNAMKELHRGTHRPYPCGAGAGYLGVAADGELAACHRFVGDSMGKMGNLTEGIDRRLQTEWLRQRHVIHQSPCSDCWARYLCGGGCYHEVMARGRPACDYIRGWLHYCIDAYARLIQVRPDYFGIEQ